MEQARKQYASDTEPLPTGSYDELTETTEFTENVLTITESRYKDPRLEKIRHQLSTEKLEQAIGRARLVTWTDTETIVFTDAPVTNITDRAVLFSSAAFNLATAPDELPDALHKIQEALDTGDVHAYAEATGKSERTAYRHTQQTRQQENADKDAELLWKAEELMHKGMSQRGTAESLDISLGKLQTLLKRE